MLIRYGFVVKGGEFTLVLSIACFKVYAAISAADLSYSISSYYITCIGSLYRSGNTCFFLPTVNMIINNDCSHTDILWPNYMLWNW
jgi:hypothetical protein